jgi:succinate dehydrogenase hydrophobic anchor subunit
MIKIVKKIIMLLEKLKTAKALLSINLLILSIVLAQNPQLFLFSLAVKLNLFIVIAAHLFIGVLSIAKDYSANSTFNFFLATFVSTNFCIIVFYY